MSLRPLDGFMKPMPIYTAKLEIGSRCEIIPRHLLEDLSIFNGEEIVVAPPAGAGLAVGAVEPIRQTIHVRLPKVAGDFHLQRTSVQSEIRTAAAAPAHSAQPTLAIPHTPQFQVYDSQRKAILSPSNQRLSSGLLLSAASIQSNPTAKRALDTAKGVFDLYHDIFKRNSIDGMGMDIVSCIHVYEDEGSGPVRMDNAFWDGKRMAYGDGDGQIHLDFTLSVDIPGHEMTHGVTQHTLGLEYEEESGALNEHISDVFGVMFRQKEKKLQKADKDSWLIGPDMVNPLFQKFLKDRRLGFYKGLRSMAEPGMAYKFIKGTQVRSDQQPSLYDQRLQLSPGAQPSGYNDYGYVHYNSGIPNKAFYLFAMSVQGEIWDVPGKLWYETMSKKSVTSTATIPEFAQATVKVAEQSFPQVVTALRQAWTAVHVQLV